ncbi:dirigent protein 11 [Solanum tuberosum]|uniref:dirigent protein 11 n=1 Tax=Solanum tuberosum TaxID=4113 RepID=UPI0003D2782E|nr:PREDICTED: dirigent protein 11 [Solanum tuberosum]
MIARIIFCIAILLAILSVILLAIFSPIPNQNKSKYPPWVDLSLYIQQPRIPSSNFPSQKAPTDFSALIFHRLLTEGPENTSRIVGKAQGFIIPIQDFANSAFNIIYLTFNSKEFSGSLSVEAKSLTNDNNKLNVVGGTGYFAFARGLAIFAQTKMENINSDNLEANYYQLKLQLKYPNKSKTIPR